MALIEWSEALSVHIAEIDVQHKSLIDYINRLHGSILCGQEIASLPKIFEDLEAYAQEHFATEEKYFERFQYPMAAEHIQEHTDFIRDLGAFKNRHDQGEIDIAMAMLKFLSDWLLDHLHEKDADYAAYFKEKGVI